MLELINNSCTWGNKFFTLWSQLPSLSCLARDQVYPEILNFLICKLKQHGRFKFKSDILTSSYPNHQIIQISHTVETACSARQSYTTKRQAIIYTPPALPPSQHKLPLLSAANEVLSGPPVVRIGRFSGPAHYSSRRNGECYTGSSPPPHPLAAIQSLTVLNLQW